MSFISSGFPPILPLLGLLQVGYLDKKVGSSKVLKGLGDIPYGSGSVNNSTPAEAMPGDCL